MDKLKDYITHNRPKLDIHVPDQAAWEQLDRRLTYRSGKRGKVFFFFRAALAACVIGLAGIGLYFLLLHEEEATQAEKPLLAYPRLPARQLPRGTDAPTRQATGDSAALPEAAVLHPLPSGPERKNQEAQTKGARGESDINAVYASRIQQQIEKINSTPIFADDPAFFSVYVQQLQHFTAIEKQIREELALFGTDDRKLEAMVHIYQTKLALLERLLEDIKRVNRFPEQSKARYLKL